MTLGFARYLEVMRKRDPRGKLFPDIRPGRHSISAAWSKWFGRYVDGIGLTDSRLVFHSFRHTFITAARRVMDEETRNKITGHTSENAVGRTYGDHDMAVLKKAIDQVSFPVSIPKWKR